MIHLIHKSGLGWNWVKFSNCIEIAIQPAALILWTSTREKYELISIHATVTLIIRYIMFCQVIYENLIQIHIRQFSRIESDSSNNQNSRENINFNLS